MVTTKWPLSEAEIKEHADAVCVRCEGAGLTPECYYDGSCSEYCSGVVICPCVRGEKQPDL